MGLKCKVFVECVECVSSVSSVFRVCQFCVGCMKHVSSVSLSVEFVKLVSSGGSIVSSVC